MFALGRRDEDLFGITAVVAYRWVMCFRLQRETNSFISCLKCMGGKKDVVVNMLTHSFCGEGKRCIFKHGHMVEACETVGSRTIHEERMQMIVRRRSEGKEGVEAKEEGSQRKQRKNSNNVLFYFIF